MAQTLAARNLEACFNASSASSEHSESEFGIRNRLQNFFLTWSSAILKKRAVPKRSKVENDDDSLAEPQPKKCKMDIVQWFFVSESRQLFDFIE